MIAVYSPNLKREIRVQSYHGTLFRLEIRKHFRHYVRWLPGSLCSIMPTMRSLAQLNTGQITRLAAFSRWGMRASNSFSC